ncbi:inosine guanosine and xanthosine phosphorylase family protein [Reticulomyxa filosa]|uniref:Inosine guanosine and xanthosine phosphorylase family protein n=1 Tax=Reticulomyxa filosa TaxID=46433 RepID=X6NFD9_RETFI|nr:inosine guanosine and xanthosine phosphorylase family protein [Reticulomyxa filosa]|eukprot:ETO24701.1 inosine guanosine and xanthosine phosphorylase family protein [Reticulomyxa filosa]
MDWSGEVYIRHNLLVYRDLFKDIEYLGLLTKQLLNTSELTNRNGPIPIWTIHEPFRFDVGKWFDCPLSFPLLKLPGFGTIASSTSSKRAALTFGLYQDALVILLTDLHVIIISFYSFICLYISFFFNPLDGLSFDEYNYLINLLHGVIGHQNLHFLNLFMAFNASHIYDTAESAKKDQKKSKEEQKEEKQDTKKKVSAHVFAAVNDYVDFQGGIPRFPFPLFPPKGTSGADHEEKKDSKTPELHFSFALGASESKTSSNLANAVGYAWWAGPQLPSKTEVAISEKAFCELIGVTNPELPTLARQLGHHGYNIAFIADSEDLEHISSVEMMQESSHDLYDASLFVNQLSLSIVEKFATTKNDSSIVKSQDLQVLKDLTFPSNIPAYQTIFEVDAEWEAISHASEWIRKQWDFDDKSKKIESVLVSHFAHPFLYHKENNSTEELSINMAQIPGFLDHRCGGVAYTYFHYHNDNPLEWTLKFYKNHQDTSKYYAVIAPYWLVKHDQDALKHQLYGKDFASTTKKANSYDQALHNFYKYAPSLWNLHFFIRVLWKCGIRNVVFLAQLFGTDNEKFKLPSENGVVLVSNYVDVSRWNSLTGPNDDRMGPRFVPITEPMDGNNALSEIAKRKKFGSITLPQVEVVQTPSQGIISPLTKKFHASLGLQTVVSGLVPSIEIAQHVGLKKAIIGVVDHQPLAPLALVKSFENVLQIIETSFAEFTK